MPSNLSVACVDGFDRARSLLARDLLSQGAAVPVCDAAFGVQVTLLVPAVMGDVAWSAWGATEPQRGSPKKPGLLSVAKVTRA